jgi:hypothetical protein
LNVTDSILTRNTTGNELLAEPTSTATPIASPMPTPTGPPAQPGGHGAGIFNDRGSVSVTRSMISENATGSGEAAQGGHGGGLYNAEGDVELVDCTVIANRTGAGGRTVFSLGLPGGDGAGIHNAGGRMWCDPQILS